MKRDGWLALLLLGVGVLSAAERDNPLVDLVLGQADFTTSEVPSPPTAESLLAPGAVCVDPASGKVFVADTGNHRVLRYPDLATLADGGEAEAVFGQASFAGDAANAGRVPGPRTLNVPAGVFVDEAGRLWVADTGNHRVVCFPQAAVTDSQPSAVLVLGQPDFLTAQSGVGASRLNSPLRIWADRNDRLWVADTGNHRILRFDHLALQFNGGEASAVLGQGDFETNAPASGPGGLNRPGAVALDDEGRLWVADTLNNRVLRFDAAATLEDGTIANGVIGQPDFESTKAGNDAVSLNQPLGVSVDGGRLWVADAFNNRVLRFDEAAEKTNGPTADGVLGQPDFETTSSAVTARKLSTPVHVFTDFEESLWVSDQTANRVLRFGPTAAATAPDTIPPVVRVAGSSTVVSASSQVSIRGTASDETLLEEVRYQMGSGPFRPTKGRPERWRATVTLDPDKPVTILTFRATDVAGNHSRIVKVRVIRE